MAGSGKFAVSGRIHAARNAVGYLYFNLAYAKIILQTFSNFMLCLLELLTRLSGSWDILGDLIYTIVQYMIIIYILGKPTPIYISYIQYFVTKTVIKVSCFT